MSMNAVGWLTSKFGVDIAGRKGEEVNEGRATDSPAPSQMDFSSGRLPSINNSNGDPFGSPTAGTESAVGRYWKQASSAVTQYIGAINTGGGGGPGRDFASLVGDTAGSQPSSNGNGGGGGGLFGTGDANARENTDIDENGLPVSKNWYSYNKELRRWDVTPEAPESIKREHAQKLREAEEDRLGLHRVAPPPPPSGAGPRAPGMHGAPQQSMFGGLAGGPRPAGPQYAVPDFFNTSAPPPQQQQRQQYPAPQQQLQHQQYRLPALHQSPHQQQQQLYQAQQNHQSQQQYPVVAPPMPQQHNSPTGAPSPYLQSPEPSPSFGQQPSDCAPPQSYASQPYQQQQQQAAHVPSPQSHDAAFHQQQQMPPVGQAPIPEAPLHPPHHQQQYAPPAPASRSGTVNPFGTVAEDDASASDFFGQIAETAAPSAPVPAVLALSPPGPVPPYAQMQAPPPQAVVAPPPPPRPAQQQHQGLPYGPGTGGISAGHSQLASRYAAPPDLGVAAPVVHGPPAPQQQQHYNYSSTNPFAGQSQPAAAPSYQQPPPALAASAPQQQQHQQHQYAAPQPAPSYQPPAMAAPQQYPVTSAHAPPQSSPLGARSAPLPPPPSFKPFQPT